jgi:hypothetical protein
MRLQSLSRHEFATKFAEQNDSGNESKAICRGGYVRSSSSPDKTCYSIVEQSMQNEPNDDHFKDVYAHAGLALYWCQCFEQTLANILLLQARITKRCVTLEQLDQFEEHVEAQTLGRLLKEVRQQVTFDERAETILPEALNKRNFLAHHFFKERAAVWYATNGPERLVAELESIQTLMREADSHASAVSSRLGEHLGLTDDILEAAVQELKNEAERD